MYIHHQNASLILQFVNGKKTKVTNVSKESAERNYRNGIWSSTNENTLSKNLFDPESFYGNCPNIDWIHDIFPIISVFTTGGVISIIVTIFFERDYKSYTKDNDTFDDATESTKIELRVVAKKSNDVLSLKRSLYWEGILSTTAIQKKIREEIKQINLYLSQYSIHEIQDPTKASIILPAGTGGIFVHEAIGHCLEADQYFKKDAVLNGYLGKTITNNKAITISDSCCSTDMIKYKVSDDGSIPRSLTLVKDGCLENIMTDAYSSSIYGIADSGNGRSANYYSFPIPRMRNTYIHNGTDKVEDIIKSTKYGLIPIDIQGGNVTVETGNFVFNISHALIIQSGEIVGISKPFLFSGNIINAIDSIERIGNDLKFCRDVCGKRGQLIDVAYGTPTILLSQRTHYE
ncbi:MAG: TldD/PmbA family protein [Eubacteriales bacterium]|nr:TldD/PmbA family protein [Eubacteriales bacterium]